MDDFDPSEWELIITNGVWLVGKSGYKGHPRCISPVFQVHTRLIQDEASGTVQQPLLLTPFLCQGLSSLTIPEGALRISLDNFTIAMREWEKQIRNALDQDAKLRVARLGLVAVQ